MSVAVTFPHHPLLTALSVYVNINSFWTRSLLAAAALPPSRAATAAESHSLCGRFLPPQQACSCTSHSSEPRVSYVLVPPRPCARANLIKIIMLIRAHRRDHDDVVRIGAAQAVQREVARPFQGAAALGTARGALGAQVVGRAVVARTPRRGANAAREEASCRAGSWSDADAPRRQRIRATAAPRGAAGADASGSADSRGGGGIE